MSSPFTSFANAVLTFNVPTGNVTINLVGNRVVETSPLQFTAMLKPVKDAAEVSFYVGDDDVSELMKGYLVEPLVFPATLTAPIEGKAEVKTAIGVTKSGTFKLLPLTQSPYLTGLSIEFLTKVTGVFKHG